MVWTAPAAVSGVNGQSENPEVAVRGSGEGIAAWDAPGGTVVAARRSGPGRPFGHPRRLGRGAVADVGFADGRPVVILVPNRNTVRVVTMRAGLLRAVATLQRTPEGTFAFDGRADRPGVLAWTAPGGVRVAEISGGGIRVGARSLEAWAVRAAAAAENGRASLVVGRVNALGLPQLALVAYAADGFGAPVDLAEDPGAVARAWAAREDAGTTAVTTGSWPMTVTGRDGTVDMGLVGADGRTSTGRPFGPLDSVSVGAGSDGRGGLLASWVQPRSGGTYAVMAALRPRGGGWGAVHVVLKARWRPHSPSVVLLPDGRAAVALSARCGGRARIVVLRRTARGRWAPPEVAATWPGYLAASSLGTDARGRLTLVWPRRLTAGGGYRSIPIQGATRTALP
jgi:hypothetical protein